MSYTNRIVATKDDINKQIEVEIAHLMYYDFKSKNDAIREAKFLLC